MSFLSGDTFSLLRRYMTGSSCCRFQRSSSIDLPNTEIINFEEVRYLGEANRAENVQLSRPYLRREEKYSAVTRRSLSQAMSGIHQSSSNDAYPLDTANRPHLKRVLRIPPASWSRFPSHSRAERSFGPAGKSEHVHSRDFALEMKMTDSSQGKIQRDSFLGVKNKSRRMTFGNNLVATLRRLHGTDLRVLEKGFRSSISVEGDLEYPELEILPSLGPMPLSFRAPLSSPIEASPYHVMAQASQTIPQKTNSSARNRSQMYEGCVHDATNVDETSERENASAFLHPEAASWHSRRSTAREPSPRSSMEIRRYASNFLHPESVSRQGSRSTTRDFSPRSSVEMRRSTVDFQKCLEDYEAKVRDKALQAARIASDRQSQLSGLKVESS